MVVGWLSLLGGRQCILNTASQTPQNSERIHFKLLKWRFKELTESINVKWTGSVNGAGNCLFHNGTQPYYGIPEHLSLVVSNSLVQPKGKHIFLNFWSSISISFIHSINILDTSIYQVKQFSLISNQKKKWVRLIYF